MGVISVIVALPSHIKAIVGSVLIIYSLFLTPAFLDPTDLIISTAWITFALASDVPIFLIALWMLSGYLAFIVGIALVGHAIVTKLPAIAAVFHNPVGVLALIFACISIAVLWYYYAA